MSTHGASKNPFLTRQKRYRRYRKIVQPGHQMGEIQKLKPKLLRLRLKFPIVKVLGVPHFL